MNASITAAIVALRSLPGITAARYWQTPDGSKRRIYLSTVKLNGGRTWNGGVGHRDCYLDLSTGVVMAGECAGAATRDFHAEHDTFNAVVATYRAAINSGETHAQD